MIGKPEWFKYRIFGWGLAPKTWQGYLYVAMTVLIIVITSFIPMGSGIKPLVMGIIFTILIGDVLHIMINLPKTSDERDNHHQLIIERNCSFAAIMAIAGIIVYQTYKNKEILNVSGNPFDQSLLIVLGIMLMTKIITTLYVKYKM